MTIDMHLSRDERRVYEETTPIYRADLVAEDGTTAIALADVTSLTLTLYNANDLSIINARDHVSVLNANGGTLHATSGAFQWQAESDDMVIVSVDCAIGEVDPAILLLEWELTNGQKGKHWERIDVINVGHVPVVVVP